MTIYASQFEGIQSYQNTFLMWSKFLRIQGYLYGENAPQMIQTYRKLSTLALAIQQPSTSQKFLDEAQRLILKFTNLRGDSSVAESEEDKKARL